MEEKKYIEIKVKKDCTGCRACEQKCPKNAIQMVEDEEGFLYPKVDKEKCINCGICKNICPQINNVKNDKEKNTIIYGIKPKNDDASKKSTSGGIAYLISKKIIQENGIVVGCAYDNEMNANHICVENVEDLEKIRGSKYVTSNTNSTFTQIKESLNQGKKVFFTGCPCQVAGLKKYLGKDYENLITADIVCHGVPSQKIFKKYLNWLEEKIGDKIINYTFRNKEKVGWGLGFCAKIDTKNKTIYKNADFDPYYTAFLNGKIYRECCYSCKYANVNRIGDITLADFWGIEKFDKNMYTPNGVSLVFANNEKGKNIIENISENIEIKEYTQDQATKYNLNLVQPTKRPEDRDIIYKQLDEINFDEYSKKYLLPKNKVKIIIKNLIPKKIKLLYKMYLK